MLLGERDTIFNAYADQKEEAAGLRLVSCGHIFAKHGREIYRPKGREDWLLFYVAKEADTFYLPRETEAPAGSFVLFAPHEVQHHIYKGEKTAEFYYVHFRGERLPQGFSLETSKVYRTEPSGQVAVLFEEMIEETLKKLPRYESLCLYKLMQLLTLLERSSFRTDHPMGAHFEQIAYVVQQMNRDPGSERSLGDYAALCNMSKYHFLRVFTQIVGCPPLEYRNQLRLSLAKELLRESNLSVGEIAEESGFSSAAYFSDFFKRKVGFSPRQYRERIK